MVVYRWNSHYRKICETKVLKETPKKYKIKRTRGFHYYQHVFKDSVSRSPSGALARRREELEDDKSMLIQKIEKINGEMLGILQAEENLKK